MQTRTAISFPSNTITSPNSAFAPLLRAVMTAMSAIAATSWSTKTPKTDVRTSSATGRCSKILLTAIVDEMQRQAPKKSDPISVQPRARPRK